MHKNILFVVISFIFCLSSFAQTSRFDEKVDLGNGLFKVKANNRWGLIDKNGNLILSIEYNEPLFMNGKAVLSKYGSQQIDGIVDSTGNFRETLHYYVNASYPFVTDGMLAVRETLNGKWGFLNPDTGELLTVNFNGFKLGKNKLLKALGFNGKGVKGSFVFDFVAPFVEGLAVVYTEKTGWHHIDKNGQERLKNPSLKPTMFRTSIHNGETVIFDDRGIVLCMEEPTGNAGIIKYVDENYEVKNYNVGLYYPYVIQTNGSKLFLNTKFQADKYENANSGDSIIFIERPPVIQRVEEPKDSFILDRDIKVTLSKKSVSAGAKGTAAITVNISNVGEFDSKDISVSINVNGTKKSWEGTIAIGATQ
ncbi:MAG: WG repeat-containing protein [Muribaculum sp.]|nr:WG repeat-containing protein [Muribaculum sp.]